MYHFLYSYYLALDNNNKYYYLCIFLYLAREFNEPTRAFNEPSRAWTFTYLVKITGRARASSVG
jgi:hypothetical protein